MNPLHIMHTAQWCRADGYNEMHWFSVWENMIWIGYKGTWPEFSAPTVLCQYSRLCFLFFHRSNLSQLWNKKTARPGHVCAGVEVVEVVHLVVEVHLVVALAKRRTAFAVRVETIHLGSNIIMKVFWAILQMAHAMYKVASAVPGKPEKGCSKQFFWIKASPQRDLIPPLQSICHDLP